MKAEIDLDVLISRSGLVDVFLKVGWPYYELP
jgi:hypothetical protein